MSLLLHQSFRFEKLYHHQVKIGFHIISYKISTVTWGNPKQKHHYSFKSCETSPDCLFHHGKRSKPSYKEKKKRPPSKASCCWGANVSGQLPLLFVDDYVRQGDPFWSPSAFTSKGRAGGHQQSACLVKKLKNLADVQQCKNLERTVSTMMTKNTELPMPMEVHVPMKGLPGGQSCKSIMLPHEIFAAFFANGAAGNKMHFTRQL